MKLEALAALVLAAQAVTSPSPTPQPAQTVEQRIDAAMARQMSARRIPGLSLGVVRNGALIYAKGYGDATLEWKQPATPDTVFLLASMTKQFTATAVMMLVRDGKVALDDGIGKYVDDPPPAWRGITIRHLLTHTAGLKDRFEVLPGGRFPMDSTTAQMLDAAKATPVDAAPGAVWQYSDQGYFLLGLVIERASGMSYRLFLQEKIFAPLGMTSTSLHNWNAIVPQRADGYALFGNALVASRRRYQFGLVSHYGVQSTVNDLAKYDAALSAGTLVPASTLAEMWTPGKLADGQPAEIAGIGYGYGWFLEQFRGHREVHHGGSTGTCLYRLPNDGVSVIVLTNLEQASGSDPCGTARMVAAQYVPDTAIPLVPPIDDPNPQRAARLRGVVEAFAQGKVGADDYTPAALKVIGDAAKVQAAGFAKLGPIESFQLIADDALVRPVVWYRARYASTVLQFRFVLDPTGKVSSLQAR
jgi:CubicO group peptidase (beta-lactamase class C family)